MIDALCACGASSRVPFTNLRTGRSTQCSACEQSAKRLGPHPYTSVMPNRRLREVWVQRYWNMRYRCEDERNEAYRHYGGRGIAVCEAWRRDPAVFLRFIQTLDGWDRPDELEIDRAENDGGYEPGNVRLVPHAENLSNTRRNRFVEHSGQRYTVSEFGRRFCPQFRCLKSIARRAAAGKTSTEIIADALIYPRKRA